MGSWRQRAWVGIGLGCALGWSACDVAVLRGLSREDARELAAALDRSGVVAHIVADGPARVRLDVNEAAVDDAVAVLARLPAAGRCEADSGGAAGGRWLETASEERARTEHRLERSLADSLARLPGVLEARVHLTLSAGMRALPETGKPAAASVLLVRSAAAPAVTTQAQELVAGAIADLTPAAVRVVEIVQQRATAEPRFARVGPIVVKKESEAVLELGIAGALVLQMLLAIGLLRPLWRRNAR